jgi:hypothetical protein
MRYRTFGGAGFPPALIGAAGGWVAGAAQPD